MVSVQIRPSTLSSKKWTAVVGSRRVHFGAKGYEDFTIHKDVARRQRYIARHRAREDWTNVYSAGFWSRWLLWNRTTLRASVKDTMRRFPRLKITLMI